MAISIIINGETKTVEEAEIDYRKVVELAHGSKEADSDTVFTITYHKADGAKTEGILSPGKTVTVKDGTRFCAVVTGYA